MSSKVKNPTQGGHGFLWTMIVIILLAVAVIGWIVYQTKGSGADSSTSSAGDKVTISHIDVDMHVDGTSVSLKSSKATADTPHVDLYEDFSCPHCSEIALATDDEMKEALEEGKLVVDVRSLNFLDRGQVGHSTKAGAAAFAVAKAGNVDQYWSFRAALMAKQSEIWNKWDKSDFANLAKDLGVDKDTVKKIADGDLIDTYIKDANANSAKLEAVAGHVSSPSMILNGDKVIQLSENWVADAIAGKAEAPAK